MPLCLRPLLLWISANFLNVESHILKWRKLRHGGPVPKVPGATGHKVFWLHLCSLAKRQPHGFTHRSRSSGGSHHVNPFFSSPLLLLQPLRKNTFNLWPWIPVISIYGKPFWEGANDLNVYESHSLVRNATRRGVWGTFRYSLNNPGDFFFPLLASVKSTACIHVTNEIFLLIGP